jgi:DNA modification methylase
MEVLSVPISGIKPYENNPRKNDKAVDKVAESIREFGFKQPIVADKDGVIIAGHTRYKAAMKLGLTDVPVLYALDLSPEQVKAYRLADNKTAEFSGWDSELLSIELNDLMLQAFDMTRFGFMDPAIETQEDDFNVDDVPEIPVSRQGDVWHLGRHRLRCGDSTVQDDVRTLMASEKARMVFTDPPWNVDYGADEKHPSWKPRQILNDKMSTEDFGAFLLKAFACMKAVSEPGCMTYVVMSGQEWGNLMTAMSDLGYHWSSTIIWVKDSLVLSRKDYHTQHEPIWYGWLESARLCPLQDRKQSDVWEFERPRVSVEHPTMKPIGLVAKAIANSSRKGDVVLDLFGGSGTTLIAAEQTDRVCRMMELDPKYCDVIVKRFVGFKNEYGEVFLERDGQRIPYTETGIAMDTKIPLPALDMEMIGEVGGEPSSQVLQANRHYDEGICIAPRKRSTCKSPQSATKQGTNR